MGSFARDQVGLLFLLLPFVAAWTGSPPQGPDLEGSDVFVIAGQSNAVGASTLRPVDSSYFGSPLDSWVYNLCFTWTLANEPVHCYVTDGRTGAWPTFAYYWMAEVRRPVILIATAVGGTCLVGPPYVSEPPSWDPDSPDGTLYQLMVDMVDHVAPGPRLRAVLWYQGECEVANQVPYAVYKSALMRLGDRVGEDLGVPLIVAPVSLRPPPWPLQPSRTPIHDATVDAAAEHPNILLGPETDDLAHEADGTHIHAVWTLGVRWFVAASARLPPACRDGIDNDGNGTADFPTDPGCSYPSDRSEKGPACGLGFEVAPALALLGLRLSNVRRRIGHDDRSE